MNGSDHVQPQPGLAARARRPRARAARRTRRSRSGASRTFLARAPRGGAGATAPAPRRAALGLCARRCSPGCASARMPQKRADFANDVLLTRYLEPLAAWLGALGGDADPGGSSSPGASRSRTTRTTRSAAARSTPCTTQMDARFARVAQIAARRTSTRVGAALAERVAAGPAGGRGRARLEPARRRGAATVDAELELDLPLARGRAAAFHLRDAAGRRVPAAADVVDAGACSRSFDLPAAGAAHLLDGHAARLRRRAPARAALDAARGTGGSRSTLRLARRLRATSISRRRSASCCALLAAGGFERVRVRAARCRACGCASPMRCPGYGLRAYRVARGAHAARPRRRAPERRAERLAGRSHRERESARRGGARRAASRSSTAPSGLAHRGRAARRLRGRPRRRVQLRPGAGRRRRRPAGARARDRRGEREAEVERRASTRATACRGSSRRAVGARSRAERRAARRADAPARARGSTGSRSRSTIENTARDHRLRLALARAVRGAALRVESAFEIAERPIAPARDAFGSARPSEFPIGACPQRRFASVDDGRFALTVANRGGGEVEALRGRRRPRARSRSRCCAPSAGSRAAISRSARRRRAGAPDARRAGARGPSARLLACASTRPTTRAAIAEALRFAVPPLAFPGARRAAADARPDGARLVEIDDPNVLRVRASSRTRTAAPCCVC